ncbi:MAG: P-loop NTPase [Elusimicrobiales bacterium]
MVKNIDPRIALIDDNLKDIRKIYLVSGFKGGIGKSIVATFLSIALSDRGYKVGLLDLDITSFSCHRILGVYDIYPYEENGIIAPVVYGISFMSFQFFSNSLYHNEIHPNSKILQKAVALRGGSISDAIKEILTITRWGRLDYLIVDMPAGFYDVAFDVINLIKRFKVIAVRTPSPLSLEVYNRMIVIYKEKGYEIIEIENMVKDKADMKIRYDSSIDAAIGDIEKIKNTKCYSDIYEIALRL